MNNEALIESNVNVYILFQLFRRVASALPGMEAKEKVDAGEGK